MTPGQRACEAMNRYNLALFPDSPPVTWEGLSDEGRQGWEVTAAAVREPVVNLLREWFNYWNSPGPCDPDGYYGDLERRTAEALK